jgi:DNA-binding beta-propeller fold protein YncE
VTRATQREAQEPSAAFGVFRSAAVCGARRDRRAVLAAGVAAALIAFALAATAAPPSRLVPRLVIWGYADGTNLSRPRGAAFDPLDGAIYVANTGAHRIETFSKTGRPLHWFVHRVTGADGALVDGEPCALAFDRAGRLLVADNAASYVDVLDRRGRPLRRLDLPGERPIAIAVGPEGTIYVASSGEASRIHRFGSDYAPAGSWGEPGAGPGQLRSVTALAILPDSTLAVTCARTELGVQIFTGAGAYLRGFATHEMGPGNISLPSGVVGSPDGRIWVCDEIRQSVQVFDRDGSFLTQATGEGAAPGEVSYPSSFVTDGRGLIAVTERLLGRLQVLALPQDTLPADSTGR